MTHRTVKSLAEAAKPEDLFRGQWQHNRTSVPTSTSPNWMNAGTRAAPTPGSSGKRSFPWAIEAATAGSAPTCDRSAPRHGRTPRNRLHPAW
jgi:hypothetical protein